MFLQVRKGVLGVLLSTCAVFILGIGGTAILLSDDGVDQPAFNVSGMVPAVFTSLNDDQSVNLEVIPAYVDYLVNSGIKAVLVGGSSGEHMALTVADRKRLIDSWVKASRGTDLHIQVQVGGAPFPDVVDLTKHCAATGVHSLLTLPDLYSKPHSVDELVDYMELVARAAPNLPLFYYHIPKKSFVNINMPQFVKAASKRIKNFKGIKFTSNDLVEASQVLKVLRKDQKIFLGGEHLLAPGALLGIDSCISPAINLFPGLVQNILDAVRNDYVTNAKDRQDTLSTIVNDISAEGGRIPAMKVALELLTGIKMGLPALPSKPVSEENRKNIKENLKNFNPLRT